MSNSPRMRRLFRRLVAPSRLESRNLLAGDLVGLWQAEQLMDAPDDIVINELHVNPDVATEQVEFIELHNKSDTPVSLKGMYFSDGVQFVFAEDAWIAPHGFFTITQDAEAFQQKFGLDAGGQFSGRLSNEGESVTLRTAAGALIDRVDYGQGFPWPTVGDAPGYSMELIHPNLDNQLGGSWRASVGTQSIFETGERWRYFKGTEEPSPEPSAWKQPGLTTPHGMPEPHLLAYRTGIR